MSREENGGPAFPCRGVSQYDNGEPVFEFFSGISMRDYFAAQAIAGCIASPTRFIHGGEEVNTPELYAVIAYLIADAMLEARDK